MKNINKKNLNLLRKIDFWSKHQELDKFNISNDTSVFLGTITITLSLLAIVLIIVRTMIDLKFFPLLQEKLNFLFILMPPFVASIFLLYYSIIWELKVKRHNYHFRAREIMIRKWYDKIWGEKTVKVLEDHSNKIRYLLRDFDKKRISKEKFDKELEKILSGN